MVIIGCSGLFRGPLHSVLSVCPSLAAAQSKPTRLAYPDSEPRCPTTTSRTPMQDDLKNLREGRDCKRLRNGTCKRRTDSGSRVPRSRPRLVRALEAFRDSCKSLSTPPPPSPSLNGHGVHTHPSFGRAGTTNGCLCGTRLVCLVACPGPDQWFWALRLGTRLPSPQAQRREGVRRSAHHRSVEVRSGWG